MMAPQGGVVGSARRRFGDRLASLLISTPIVVIIASLDAFLAAASAGRQTFVDEFASLRARRKQLRSTQPTTTEEER